MAIRVKAVERNVSFNKDEEDYRFVMLPELYNRITEDKVLAEASAHSGISIALLKASCSAISDVLLAWITEGHSVAIPNIGSMRFSINSKSVNNVEDVGTDLISSKKIIFTPSVDIKNELKRTSINITCFDRNGKQISNISGSNPDDDDDNDGGSGSDSGNNSGGGNSNPGGDFVG